MLMNQSVLRMSFSVYLYIYIYYYLITSIDELGQ